MIEAGELWWILIFKGVVIVHQLDLSIITPPSRHALSVHTSASLISSAPKKKSIGRRLPELWVFWWWEDFPNCYFCWVNYWHPKRKRGYIWITEDQQKE